MRGLFLGLLILTGLLTAPATAHERSRSSSSWTINDDRIHGVFLLDARQATLFLGVMPEGTSLEGGYRTRLLEGIRIRRNGEACTPDEIPAITLLSDGRLRGRMSWHCPQPGGSVAFDIQVFTPFSPNHVHFAQLRFGDAPYSDFVLTQGRTLAQLDPDAGPQTWLQRAARFFLIGVEHILGGPDHLAFLIGLMLVIARPRDILIVTLGFTLGHSATLALAYFGWVSPPGAALEALIGFSILFVAAEAALQGQPPGRRLVLACGGGLGLLALANLTLGGAISASVWLGLIVLSVSYLAWLDAGGRAERATPILSTGFGLVHGVGFAGILLELDLGRDDRVPALLGFNLGVEAGQLLFVLTSGGAVYLISKIWPGATLQPLRLVLVALLAGLGAFWLIGRAWS